MVMKGVTEPIPAKNRHAQGNDCNADEGGNGTYLDQVPEDYED